MRRARRWRHRPGVERRLQNARRRRWWCPGSVKGRRRRRKLGESRSEGRRHGWWWRRRWEGQERARRWLIRRWTRWSGRQGRARRWPRRRRWRIEVAGGRCRYRGAWGAPLHGGAAQEAPVFYFVAASSTASNCGRAFFEATARLNEPFATLVLPNCCPICARARAPPLLVPLSLGLIQDLTL